MSSHKLVLESIIKSLIFFVDAEGLFSTFHYL